MNACNAGWRVAQLLFASGSQALCRHNGVNAGTWIACVPILISMVLRTSRWLKRLAVVNLIWWYDLLQLLSQTGVMLHLTWVFKTVLMAVLTIIRCMANRLHKVIIGRAYAEQLLRIALSTDREPTNLSWNGETTMTMTWYERLPGIIRNRALLDYICHEEGGILKSYMTCCL